jgi:hypothetical protein
MDRIPIPPEVLQTLKGRHGARLHITTVQGQPEEFALVKATAEQCEEFIAALSDDDTKADALEDLALACVVYPELEPILDGGRPAIAVPLGAEIGKLSGLADNAKEVEPERVEGSAELLAAHRNLHFVSVPGTDGVFGVTPPSRAAWKKFLKLSGDKVTKVDAFRGLVAEVVPYPADFVTGALKELPFLAITLGNQSAKYGGMSSSTESKKA